MKAAITAAIPALSCLVGCGSLTERPKAPPGTALQVVRTVDGHEVPPGELVTDAVVKMNSAEYARPPTSFLPGRVTPHEAPRVQETPTGFSVAFDSRYTVTTPTVHERAVIVSGGFATAELYAFEATTGASLWAIDLHDTRPSSPACERGVCVVSTESCTLFAIAADTGKELWSSWLGDPPTCAPTIANDRVFASYKATEATEATETTEAKPRPPGATHALAAFELRTGKILWQLWLESDVMSASVAASDFVYVTTFTGIVIKLEQATGKVRYAVKTRATSAPVVRFDGGANEDEVKHADYIDKNVQPDSAHATTSTAEDSGNSFSGGAPSTTTADYAFENGGVGSMSSMQSFQGSRTVKLRDRNVNTLGDEVIATDSETGKTLWSYRLAGQLQQQGVLGTAPLAAGNSILFGTLEGEVVRLDQKSGKVVGTYAVGAPIHSQPVVANGWIYVSTDDSRLVAIDTKDPTVTGWPTWGGNAQRTGVQH